MWFIGLEFCKNEGGLSLELTYEIQTFINAGVCVCARVYLLVEEISVHVFISILVTNPVMLNPAVTNNRELWSGTQLNVRHVRK